MSRGGSGLKLLIDRGLPDHRKVHDLADRLGCRPAEALGMVVSLWCRVLGMAEDGDLAGWSDVAIARAALGEARKAGELVMALRAVGLLDGEASGALKIHDWLEQQGWLIEKRARERDRRARLKLEAAEGAPTPAESMSAAPPGPARAEEAQEARAPRNWEEQQVATWNRQTASWPIGYEKGARLIRAAIAAHASRADIEKAVMDSAGCAGKRLWEVLDLLTPRRDADASGTSWAKVLAEMKLPGGEK